MTGQKNAKFLITSFFIFHRKISITFVLKVFIRKLSFIIDYFVMSISNFMTDGCGVESIKMNSLCFRMVIIVIVISSLNPNFER